MCPWLWWIFIDIEDINSSQTHFSKLNYYNVLVTMTISRAWYSKILLMLLSEARYFTEDGICMHTNSLSLLTSLEKGCCCCWNATMLLLLSFVVVLLLTLHCFVANTIEHSIPLVTVDSPAMDSRNNSQTSLASHNKQTFQRILGSFRSAGVSKNDMTADGPSMYCILT